MSKIYVSDILDEIKDKSVAAAGGVFAVNNDGEKYSLACEVKEKGRIGIIPPKVRPSRRKYAEEVIDLYRQLAKIQAP